MTTHQYIIKRKQLGSKQLKYENGDFPNTTVTLTRQAAKLKTMKKFCLQICDGQLKLKVNHNYYYQCQGLMNVVGVPWLDFVVCTERPYEIHVERIFRDLDLWMNSLVPKLKAFYFKALLPELACPRH